MKKRNPAKNKIVCSFFILTICTKLSSGSRLFNFKLLQVPLLFSNLVCITQVGPGESLQMLVGHALRCKSPPTVYVKLANLFNI